LGKTLILRPESVLLAYVLSPLASLGFIWAGLTIYDLMQPDYSLLRDVLIFFWLFFVGGFVCVILELLIVTPVLILFERYHWRWLNGWSAAAIGFAVGAIFWLFIVFCEVWSGGPVLSTLLETTLEASFLGLAGLVGGLTFRFIAVEKA
jgi:hypothetical protein